ncbi:MAG: family 78 glycoside hydrolase catalytic domain, partial [Huintestinicola sp.]
MLKIKTLFIDGGRIRSGHRFSIIDTERPLFSWSVLSDADDNAQTECRVIVKSDKVLWDSGYMLRSEQSLRYEGERLPHGVPLTAEISVKDRYGRTSEHFARSFVSGKLDAGEFQGFWIKHPSESADSERVYRFRRDFGLEKLPVSACLYCSGIGYQRVFLNGRELSDARLDPAHSDYSKLVYYTVDTNLIPQLSVGENTLGIEVAPGWRNNRIGWYNGADPTFFGETQMWAMLVLTYQDGRTEVIATDETWNVGYSAVISASIYNGETFDARLNDPTDLLPGPAPKGFVKAVKAEAPGGILLPMTLEPIRPTETYRPIEITSPKNGLFVVDFGQNIAGVARLILPETLECGQTLTLKFSEELSEDGNLYPDTLRTARSTDTYIASGDFRDLDVWEPHFTYHGFRYCSVEGLDTLSKNDISAVLIGTDLKNESFFRCGSALVNEIQRCIVMTERDNMHSILTDCPQRDERLAWMNDATVRFEEMPYNFDIGRIFPKVVRDIKAAQQSDGSITCCCPLYLGSRPADPVCSSYLIAVYQAWMATGDTSLIKESFDGLAAWEECLLSHSDDYIVNYSYYGDWASPVYACETEVSPASGVTDRLLMSTGYSYFNCRLLAKLAAAIGKEKDIGHYNYAADKIREAFLKRWHDGHGKVSNGSEAEQAFALWLGILPEEVRERAAELLVSDLVSRDYRFTTGNLCTRYMVDMLMEYGYKEEAWKLLNKETYPSFGYMIQNEATTIWERFELSKKTDMNSHNHPMYGSVGYCFYRYLAGIKPLSPGWDRVGVSPCIPDGLCSAHSVVDTVKGELSVRWSVRYGKKRLFLQIPFGVTAEVDFCNVRKILSSGYHVI